MHLFKYLLIAIALVSARPAVADTLVTAVLPTSRSAVFGEAVTVFATVINASGRSLQSCEIQAVTDGTGVVIVNYQRTDPSTNAVVGALNPLFDMAVGASQSLVLTLGSGDAMVAMQVRPIARCSDPTGTEDDSISIDGLNTILYSIGPQATPDVIALVASPSNDGVLRIQDTGGNAFAVAVSNVGTADTITASVDTGSATVPVTASICQTGADGQCLQTPTLTTSLTLPANGTASFGVFVYANGEIPFYPAGARVFVRFADSNQVVRGATSVAVTNAPAPNAALPKGGIFFVNATATGPGIKAGTPVPSTLFLAEDGEAQWIDDAGNVLSGTLSIGQDLSMSGMMQYQDFAEAQVTSDTWQGAIGQRAWFGAEVATGTSPPGGIPAVLSMVGSYQAGLYERAASLGNVSGSWNLRTVSGDLIGTAYFTAAGNYSGSISGCNFSGQIGLIDQHYGLYRMQAFFSNCPTKTLTGLAALYDEHSPNDTLYFIGNNATVGEGGDIVFVRF